MKGREEHQWGAVGGLITPLDSDVIKVNTLISHVIQFNSICHRQDCLQAFYRHPEPDPPLRKDPFNWKKP